MSTPTHFSPSLSLIPKKSAAFPSRFSVFEKHAVELNPLKLLTPQEA